MAAQVVAGLVRWRDKDGVCLWVLSKLLGCSCSVRAAGISAVSLRGALFLDFILQAFPGSWRRPSQCAGNLHWLSEWHMADRWKLSHNSYSFLMDFGFCAFGLPSVWFANITACQFLHLSSVKAGGRALALRWCTAGVPEITLVRIWCLSCGRWISDIVLIPKREKYDFWRSYKSGLSCPFCPGLAPKRLPCPSPWSQRPVKCSRESRACRHLFFGGRTELFAPSSGYAVYWVWIPC